MVDSVTGVTSATSTAAAASNSDKVQEKAKQEELVKKAQEKKETDKVTTTEKTTQTTMDRLRVKELVLQYLEKLKKDNDYPSVHSKIDRWLSTFDVDKFIQKYPEIYSEKDLNTIMYNETISFL